MHTCSDSNEMHAKREKYGCYLAYLTCGFSHTFRFMVVLALNLLSKISFNIMPKEAPCSTRSCIFAVLRLSVGVHKDKTPPCMSDLKVAGQIKGHQNVPLKDR